MSYTIHNSLVTCFGHFVDIYLFGGYIFFASIASWSSRCGVWVSLTSINLNKALSIEWLFWRGLSLQLENFYLMLQVAVTKVWYVHNWQKLSKTFVALSDFEFCPISQRT